MKIKKGDRICVIKNKNFKADYDIQFYKIGDKGTVKVVCGKDAHIQFDKIKGKYRNADGYWWCPVVMCKKIEKEIDCGKCKNSISKKNKNF